MSSLITIYIIYFFKYIAHVLKSYLKDEINNARNSTTFSNYIRNVPIEGEEIVVSFDITSLYTNISITDRSNDDSLFIQIHSSRS